MGFYKITRQKPEGKAVHGTIQDETSFKAPTLENTDYIIPTGTYKLIVTLSPKYKVLMPLVLSVTGRSGIRIHFGTKPSHSKGCILMTTRTGYQELTKRLLEEQDRKEPIYLNITQL